MTDGLEVPPELLRQIAAVKAKRPKTVLDHLEHGSITTDELKEPPQRTVNNVSGNYS